MEPRVIATVNMLSEALNQLSFISAILGGFSIALIAGVLTLERTRLTKTIIIVMSTVSSLQIGCTLFFALVSFRLLTYTANNKLEKLQTLTNQVDPTLAPFALAFFISILLFFVGIALTSWVFGKKVGWIVSIISGVAFLMSIYGLRILG